MARYNGFQQRLAAELGTDPGTAFRKVRQAIARSDLPPLESDSAASPTHQVSRTRCPPDVSAFVGRDVDQYPSLDAGEPLGQNLAYRPSGPIARPAQLPSVCATFVGRNAQMLAMTAILVGTPGSPTR